MVSTILDCHILTQVQHPICCEVEEILQSNTASRPTTFAELLALIVDVLLWHRDSGCSDWLVELRWNWYKVHEYSAMVDKVHVESGVVCQHVASLVVERRQGDAECTSRR